MTMAQKHYEGISTEFHPNFKKIVFFLHKNPIKETVKFILFNTRYLQLCPQKTVEVGQNSETKTLISLFDLHLASG